MKTIAVLTDFSDRAENAARYALHLAEHIHANIKLYNSFFIISENPMAGQIAWPTDDYNQLKLESDHELQIFADKLKKEYSVLEPGAFRPAINYECQGGNVSASLTGIEAQKEVILLVMGDHEKGMSTWLTGNHLNEIIDRVTLPVFVISPYQKFAKINRIAFATDLSVGDIEQIHALAGLANIFNAEILLVYVADEKYTDLELKHRVDSFLKDVTNKIDFSRIYYRRVKSINAEHGLVWFMEHGKADMLVMVHRHKTFLQDLFGSSVTKDIAASIQIPLLIYPSPAHIVPVF